MRPQVYTDTSCYLCSYRHLCVMYLSETATAVAAALYFSSPVVCRRQCAGPAVESWGLSFRNDSVDFVHFSSAGSGAGSMSSTRSDVG